MARPATLVAAALALCLLLAPPGRAWYKPAAGPSSYSVGRAAGLLSGFRRAPHARRSEPPASAGPPGRAGAVVEPRTRLRSLVSAAGGAGGGRGPGRGGRGGRGGRAGGPSASSRPQAVCVTDVSPKLRSCERLPDGRATFQCQADVFLSLRAADCRSA
ncbi:neuropeptide B [Mirounga angustirostris]|uniref:neuropeptide B n=1 Tax=Mirounga angustirostris TaxID=9716 RepID=UPI00313EAADC